MATTIQEQTFGFEFEFYGMTRRKACEIIAKELGGSPPTSYGSKYATYDQQGRKWQVVRDGSLRPQRGEGCEMVTPILTYQDIEPLQEIIRKLRENGAGVNESCGIHIHVGADKHDSRSLKNLLNMFSSKQDMIYKSLQILPVRESNFARKISDSLVENVKRKKPKNLIELGHIWYGSDISQNMTKYNSTRYRGLNLHNVWYGATVEFRLFNSTTHAGKVKAYIQFCLAMSAQAINNRSVSPRKTVSDNEKYTFRTWLLRLGLNGEEFKTCRTHMLANLEGNSAWRNGQAN